MGIGSGPTLMAVVRNEIVRLPYFLSYYRKLGIQQFILVDNDSSDGTLELLSAQPDVRLFASKGSFGESNFGFDWLNALADEYCHDKWVLAVDADEFLVWPGESRGATIGALTEQLDSGRWQAVYALLLDMYSDRPFGSINYVPGEPLTDACPFFDRGPYRHIKAAQFPGHQILGGVRTRLFKELPNVDFHPPTVSKLPLVRWQKGQRYTVAHHALAVPVRLAPMRAALLHFKALDDLPAKCEREARRGEHYAGGREYRALQEAIARSASGSFFDERYSVRYRDTAQLESLGLVSRHAAF